MEPYILTAIITVITILFGIIIKNINKRIDRIETKSDSVIPLLNQLSGKIEMLISLTKQH